MFMSKKWWGFFQEKKSHDNMIYDGVIRIKILFYGFMMSGWWKNILIDNSFLLRSKFKHKFLLTWEH